MAGRPRSGATDRHVYCFVPSEELDIVVLAAYINSYIDGSATIKPSRHPRDRDRLGYTVGAASTLARDALDDLIQDSKDWEKEQDSREFEECPYKYEESDTWAHRKRLGPAKRTPARTEPRRANGRQEASAPSSQYSVQSSVVSRHESKRPNEPIAPQDSATRAYTTATQSEPPPRYLPGGYKSPVNEQHGRHDPVFNAADKKHAGRDGRSEGRGSQEGEQDPSKAPAKKVPAMLANDSRSRR